MSVGLAASAPQWVRWKWKRGWYALVLNGGVVPFVLSPGLLHAAASAHEARAWKLVGVGVLVAIKATVVAVIIAYDVYYPMYAKAFACYGATKPLAELNLGFCPQYPHGAYWDGSAVCRSESVDGAFADATCNTPYHALPHAWHNWPAWVTLLAYGVLIVWMAQWVPAVKLATHI